MGSRSGGTSLGPCADGIGLSMMSVYALSVAQLPVMFLITLNFPPVKLDIFATVVKTVSREDAINPDPPFNGTAVNLDHPTELHYMHSISASIGFVAVSALGTLFVLCTVYLRDKGLAGGTGQYAVLQTDIGQENYVSSNLDLTTDPTISLWNTLFLAFVVSGHVVMAATVDSPTSFHLLLLVGLMVYVSMSVLLYPKLHSEDSDVSVKISGMVSAKYFAATALYCTAMLYVGSNVVADVSNVKIQLVMLAAFMALFLLVIGHVWDPSPLMQTIINCRVLYAVFWICINISTYALWDPYIRVQFFRSDEGAKGHGASALINT